jgi:hypothetical protein
MTGKPNLLELQNVWEFNPYMLLLDLVGLCPSKSVSLCLSAIQHPNFTFYAMFLTRCPEGGD